MTANALELNTPKIGQAGQLWKVILALSAKDCVVTKFTSGNDRPSLQLDKPLQGFPAQQTNHGGKIFESTEFMGCRVYWEISIAEAAA